ncbi:hypothetical protein Gorai_014565 [Gossypium raimondii]|uniref:RNase H type-1 domain-containing protein n=1 Tax=Gossypium raimondii TaxID=29730 RepID=A0A7J8P390_GOSRA|nr:hypothetical protein [Gossypium raimondii]
MKDCPKAREILVIGGLNNRFIDGNYNCCIDWLEDVFHDLNNKAVAVFFTLLWNNWNDKNKMVLQGKMDAALVVWERAQTLSKYFKIFNLTEPPVLPPNLVCKGWTKPPNGYVKVNVDVAVSFGCSGFRAVVMDYDGFVIGGYYNNVENSFGHDLG